MQKDDINAIAARVMTVEATALHQMAGNVPLDFSGAVEAIFETKGRVIVSGVGKSGHIGTKIAATLASTGTPASFVHATEASHGDLGMVTASDFCLLISNSGETAELRDIVAHTRRFGIPMAAISSKLDSTLMRLADYKLTLVAAPEACSLGMVPTTSTTLTLAVGDALAIALMERRNFQREDFKVFHPGGKLGAKFTTVRQLMRPLAELAVVSTGTPMREIVLSMTQTGYGLGIIVDEENMIQGVISDGDLRRNIKNLFDLDPSLIASKRPVSVGPTDLVEVAINAMEKNKVYSILVLEDNQPVGLLRMHDLLRAGVA